MLGNDSLSRFAVAVLVALVVFGTVPATVAAQSDARTGGTIVVEEGETVDSLEAFGGSVVVKAPSPATSAPSGATFESKKRARSMATSRPPPGASPSPEPSTAT